VCSGDIPITTTQRIGCSLLIYSGILYGARVTTIGTTCRPFIGCHLWEKRRVTNYGMTGCLSNVARSRYVSTMETKFLSQAPGRPLALWSPFMGPRNGYNLWDLMLNGNWVPALKALNQPYPRGPISKGQSMQSSPKEHRLETCIISLLNRFFWITSNRRCSNDGLICCPPPITGDLTTQIKRPSVSDTVTDHPYPPTFAPIDGAQAPITCNPINAEALVDLGLEVPKRF
jgi:hypothetical protein